MIFVCVGSREYQFNRLLKEIDSIIEKGVIKEKVFAQIAKSDYEPKHYEWKRFLDKKEFDDYQSKADLIITHAGTGAIIGALKKKKQVIAVPRLAKYGEHIDDHQTQVAKVLEDEKYLKTVINIKDLSKTIEDIKNHPITKAYNKESNILPLINEYIEGQKKDRSNYKKMTPLTKSIILAPLNLLYLISPKLTLKIVYRIKQGRKLDLKNPKAYSEKLQWIKLYYKNPILPKLVDKYTVRKYVEKKCPEILNKLIWQGFNPEEIPWDKLPEKCVIKVTHGSGLNIICKNTKLIDRKKTQKTLKKWLRYKFIRCYGEWFYGIEKPRIIIEEFLDNGTGEAPEDYKIMCFSGKAEYITIDTDRFSNHKKNVYDTNWHFRKGVKMGMPNDKPITPLPKKITQQLIHYAELLSNGFPHARVDLYVIGNKIYFGEITFTMGAGFDRTSPYEFDLEMGEKLVLPETNRA